MPLPAPTALVRHAVYAHFIDTGRSPTRADISRRCGVALEEVEPALNRLASARQLVLDAAGGILMAHPFSAVATLYPVDASGRRYWANCAWDALGIAVILGTDTHTPTGCPDCGEPLEIAVENGVARSNGDRVEAVGELQRGHRRRDDFVAAVLGPGQAVVRGAPPSRLAAEDGGRGRGALSGGGPEVGFLEAH